MNDELLTEEIYPFPIVFAYLHEHKGKNYKGADPNVCTVILFCYTVAKFLHIGRLYVQLLLKTTKRIAVFLIYTCITFTNRKVFDSQSMCC